ncbi:MAG: hypothetical protein QMD50_03665 [Patescibacteria group bacterium]|nr:hypothetical protein [Patescibacteria group bacterium]
MPKLKFRVIQDGLKIVDYPVRPEDIDISRGLSNTFGKHEVEAAAVNLVIYCKARRCGWCPFSLSDFLQFSKKAGFDPNMVFFGLLGPWQDDAILVGGIRESFPCLVLGADGLYYITDVFVKKCQGRNREHLSKERET